MATLCLAMSALCAALAAYVGIGGSPTESGRDVFRLRARARRVLSRVVLRLSSRPPVARLVRVPSVGRLCDLVLVRLPGLVGTDAVTYAQTREEACALMLVSWGTTCLVAMVLAGSVVLAVFFLGAPIVAVPIWDAGAERRREQELIAEMPAVFRTLAMAMGAGETLAQAVEYVGSHEEGPAGQAFLRASMRLRCGVPADDALSALAGELDAPGVDLLVTALLVSQRTGSPLRELFQSSASLVERQGEFERMLSVKTAQVRLSVRIVCLLPVVLVGVLSLISPDFQRGLSTLPGLVCLGTAMAMDGVALLIIRSLMKGVL